MSQITASMLHRWLAAFADLLEANTDLLTTLDSAIGDADHGANMTRGASAIRSCIETSHSTPAQVLHEVGDAVLEGIGGAAGPLYASLFLGAAPHAGTEASITQADFAAALSAGVDALSARGRAELGDKTMFDAAQPAVTAFHSSIGKGDDLTEAIESCQRAADLGRLATEPLQARKGRASYLGPRSMGHIDPGATSITYLFDALTALMNPTS